MTTPFILNGCAFDVIHVEQIPTNISVSSACDDYFVLAQGLNIQLGGGYNRVPKKETRWDCVGGIPQGVVYRTNDQILAVEASNVYEANIVVSSNKIVGFYLPVEGAFSPLGNQIELVIR